MSSINQRVSSIDWNAGESHLNDRGYFLSSKFLMPHECDELIERYNDQSAYRKTVVMERHRFGKGEYKYFQYPLPPLIDEIRHLLYPKLVSVANQWMRHLKIERNYPHTLEEVLRHCSDADQKQPTPLILKYGAGGFNTLHQDLYGDVYFPFQAVILLNERSVDFHGGEFILVQNTPRAQSKAMVLTPGKGDLLIFTTNFRPSPGRHGYNRVNVKHGVSEVVSGRRHTLGIIFHDAAT